MAHNQLIILSTILWVAISAGEMSYAGFWHHEANSLYCDVSLMDREGKVKSLDDVTDAHKRSFLRNVVYRNASFEAALVHMDSMFPLVALNYKLRFDKATSALVECVADSDQKINQQDVERETIFKSGLKHGFTPPPSTEQGDNEESSTMSGASIVGIVVGCVVGVAIVGCTVLMARYVALKEKHRATHYQIACEELSDAKKSCSVEETPRSPSEDETQKSEESGGRPEVVVINSISDLQSDFDMRTRLYGYVTERRAGNVDPIDRRREVLTSDDISGREKV